MAYTKNENVNKIMQATAKVLKIYLKVEDIHFAYRATANDPKDRKRIVRFNNKCFKESVLNEIKLLHKNRQPLVTNRINKIIPDKLVYINHELTSKNRKLFW